MQEQPEIDYILYEWSFIHTPLHTPLFKIKYVYIVLIPTYWKIAYCV